MVVWVGLEVSLTMGSTREKGRGGVGFMVHCDGVWRTKAVGREKVRRS